jgi:AraC-like DNA-binding protein
MYRTCGWGSTQMEGAGIKSCMHIIFFAEAVSILFFTIVQLVAKDKQPLHYCMAIGCFCLGCVLLHSGAVADGLLLRIPALVNSDISAIFLAAPAFYLASLTILHEGRPPVRSHVVYFIGPALLAVGCGLYNAFTAPAYRERFGAIPGHFSTPALMVLSLSAVLLGTAAIVADLLMARRRYRAREIRHWDEVRSQVIFLFCYLAASSLVLTSVFLRDDRLYRTATAAFGLIAMAYALSRTAVFHFSHRRRISSRPPLARSEWDSRAEELTARLDKLMETSAVYRDPSLSLRRLAQALGVEPKRLSYHFRTSLTVSFRGYINEWRLKAVCHDLHRIPGRSILDTAFENGFNSKSSFNTLFFKRYGRTPREFRNERAGQTGRRAASR